jgi:hypothetical protein
MVVVKEASRPRPGTSRKSESRKKKPFSSYRHLSELLLLAPLLIVAGTAQSYLFSLFKTVWLSLLGRRSSLTSYQVDVRSFLAPVLLLSL